MTAHSTAAPDLQKLFTSCDCHTPGDPLQFGFYEINLPDAYRWIRSEASCILKRPDFTLASQLVLLIAASCGSHQCDARLAVELNGVRVGEKTVGRYGLYYFNVDAAALGRSGDIRVALKVNGKTVEQEGKQLAMIIYCVRLIDVEKIDADFDERALFFDQVKIFRGEPSRFPNRLKKLFRRSAKPVPLLADILKKKKLSGKSAILEIGAGVGWTTVLLSAFTGSRAVAIDPHHYHDAHEVNLEMQARFSRHISVLRRETGARGIQTQADLTRAVERCTFSTMSAMEMDFKDNTFDFVFSLNAFEHIPDPAAALREIKRVLKPGGEAYLSFHLLFYSDGGSHLHACGLLNKPWAQLLYSRDEIRRMILEGGKAPNEVDNILDWINGWSARRYNDLFDSSGLRIISKSVSRGFTIEGSDKSEEFRILKDRYPEEELTTIGMTLHLRKE